MTLIVPDASEVSMLKLILTPPLTLKLYGNDVTPAAADTAATYTEIAGGGYLSKSLLYANWVFTPDNPSYATYPIQTWTFTGVLNAPASCYGYFVIRTSDGLLMWAERFQAGVVPLTTVAGTQILITPRFTGSSV